MNCSRSNEICIFLLIKLFSQCVYWQHPNFGPADSHVHTNHRRAGESPSKINMPQGNENAKNKLGTIADENRMLFISRSPCFCSVLNSESWAHLPIYCIFIKRSTWLIIFPLYIFPKNEPCMNLIEHDFQSENVYASNWASL